jgi:hypothetical protein
MPKENTHAAFAYSVLDWLNDGTLKGCLSEHILTYLLGSISPDTFYYSPYSAVSEHLHGKAGNPTNEPLPDLLEDPRSLSDIAFACGYLTHCALDITFHPVIYYLSGNYYDPDARLRASAVYGHRHLETCMDLRLGNRLRIHALLSHRPVEGSAFERYIARAFSVTLAAVRKAYRTQLIYNRAFTSSAAYTLVRIMLAFDLMHDPNVGGLFYADCRASEDPFSGPIVHRDLISGLENVSTLPALMASAREKAVSMIEAAWSHNKGAMTMSELLRAIPGESLDTGKLQTPVERIRHLKG